MCVPSTDLEVTGLGAETTSYPAAPSKHTGSLRNVQALPGR